MLKEVLDFISAFQILPRHVSANGCHLQGGRRCRISYSSNVYVVGVYGLWLVLCGQLSWNVYILDLERTNKIHYFPQHLLIILQRYYKMLGSTTKMHSLILQGRNSVINVATRNGLDGPGFESRWGRDFSHLSTPILGPIQSLIQRVPGHCRG
jgi:hypothetical protein